MSEFTPEVGGGTSDLPAFESSDQRWMNRQLRYFDSLQRVFKKIQENKRPVPGIPVYPLRPSRFTNRRAFRHDVPGVTAQYWTAKEPRTGWLLDGVVMPLKNSASQELGSALVLDDARFAIASLTNRRDWEAEDALYIPAEQFTPLTPTAPLRLDYVYSHMATIAKHIQ